MIRIDASQERLLLLYSLQQLNTQVSKDNLISIIIKFIPVNFFDLSLEVKNLVDQNLIIQDDQTLLLSINNDGIRLVTALEDSIPLKIRDQIKDYIKQNREAFLSKRPIKANFKKSESGYQTSLSLEDSGEELIKIDLLTPDRDLALKICNNWKNNPYEIYNLISQILSE